MDAWPKWVRVGVFFSDVAVRFADGAAIGGPQTSDRGASVRGLCPPIANIGSEEFTFAAPLPGCSGAGVGDGKAQQMIIYRLFLDSREYLN